MPKNSQENQTICYETTDSRLTKEEDSDDIEVHHLPLIEETDTNKLVNVKRQNNRDNRQKGVC